jgi:hypothetical protein
MYQNFGLNHLKTDCLKNEIYITFINSILMLARRAAAPISASIYIQFNISRRICEINTSSHHNSSTSNCLANSWIGVHSKSNADRHMGPTQSVPTRRRQPSASSASADPFKLAVTNPPLPSPTTSSSSTSS